MANDDPTVPGRRRPAAAPSAPSDEPTAVPRGSATRQPSVTPAAVRPRAPREETTRPSARRQATPGRRSVLPPAPAAGATLTERIAGGAQRAWGTTLLAVGGAIALAVAGAWLIGRGYAIPGVIALVAILPLTLAALFVRKAPCPGCGTPILVVGIERCGQCGSWLRIEDNRLVRLEEDFIAPLPTFDFEVPLPVVPRLMWPDGEERCVVCGGRPSSLEMLDIQGTTIPLGYCGAHQDGVSWEMALSSTAVTLVKLKFRSFAYWQRFHAANEVHTRAGMWR